MKDDEASHPQDELARLQAENARLRAMIDHLERERRHRTLLQHKQEQEQKRYYAS